MNVYLLLLPFLFAEPEFSCRWGEKSELQPLPDCGVPVRVRIRLPEDTRGRFEFRRLENPGLTHYYHQKRDGQGAPKPFANLVNLFKVDLFFCPTDFVTPRTLLFHHVGIAQAKDYQCQLGPYSEGDGADAPAMGAEVPAMAAPTMGPDVPAMGADVPAMGTPAAPAEAPRDVVSGVVPPPQVTTTGRDAFARNLAAAALAVGVLSLLLWGFLAWRISRKPEEDEPAESNPSDSADQAP